MSDYNLSFKYKESPIAFELLSDLSLGKNKVTLGGQQYAISFADKDAQKLGDIQEIFNAAQEAKVTTPSDLKKISAITKFTCVKKPRVTPIKKGSYLSRIASKISHLVLGIFHACALPFISLYYFASHILRKITKPAAHSTEHLERFGHTFGHTKEEWLEMRQEKATHTLTLGSATLPNVRFTQTECRALEALYNKQTMHDMFTEEEKGFIRKFLAHIAGNMNFNKRISLLLEAFPEKEEFGKILDAFREFSFKTTKLKQLHLLGEHMARLTPKIATLQNDLPEGEKLTLAQFRAADSFISLQEEVFHPIFIKSLSLWKSMEESPFAAIAQDIQNIKRAIDAIDSRYNRECDCRAGDIVFDDMGDKKNFDDRAFDVTELFDWMTLVQESVFRRHFCHAAIGLETKTKEQQLFRVAEVRNQYGISDISYSTLCISRVFRLDFERVLSKEGLDKLCELWQDKTRYEVLKTVEEMYKKNLQTLLRGEKFTRYKNNLSRMCITALKSHTLLSWRDPATLLDELKPPQEERRKKQTEPIFCSEFVGKVLCYTLYTLGQDLKRHLEKHQIKVPQGGMVQNPISDYENFAALDPERLYELISDYAAEVAHPEFVRYLTSNCT